MFNLQQRRRVRYEIHSKVGDRWRLDAIVEDARGVAERLAGGGALDEIENAAVERANALLATGSIAAVKVVRERLREDGFSTAREIFFREANLRPEPPPSVSPLDAPAPLCAAPEELSARPACRVVSNVLRSFLDKLSVTPLELLHFHPYQRKLADNHTLLQGALNQIATVQARATGEKPAERLRALQKLVDAAEDRAREIQALRLPQFQGDFPAFAARVSAASGEGDRRFFLFAAIARHLQGGSAYMAKLDFALAALTAVPDDPWPRGCLDEFAAGCLDDPQTIGELLGRRRNLADALTALARLATGRLAESEAGAPATVGQLGAFLRGGMLPLAAEAVWDRLTRELRRGNRPLCRNDATMEWPTLLRLRDTLPPECSADVRPAIESALQERIRRYRADSGRNNAAAS
jgi:hypothetical protein